MRIDLAAVIDDAAFSRGHTASYVNHIRFATQLAAFTRDGAQIIHFHLECGKDLAGWHRAVNSAAQAESSIVAEAAVAIPARCMPVIGWTVNTARPSLTSTSLIPSSLTIPPAAIHRHYLAEVL